MNDDKKILVVNLGSEGTPQNYFCTMDNNRIMFFYEMNHLYGIPEKQDRYRSGIEIWCDNKLFDRGIYSWVGHHGGCFENDGFNYLRLRLKNKESVIKSHEKLVSYWFKDGDWIKIIKEKWEDPERWLSQITSYRQYGAQFSEVFRHDRALSVKLIRFFKCGIEDLNPKKVIFSNQPDNNELHKFF